MSNINTVKPASFLRPFFNDVFDDSFFSKNTWDNLPAVNISETDKAYTIEMAAPGFKKEDLKVKVENNTLTVSAETRSETNEEKKDYTRREFFSNSFTRSFRLQENVKDTDISAKYENGILCLTLPKSDIATTATKEVRVS